MKKLFLTSLGLRGLKENFSFEENSVCAFIPTAADTYSEIPWIEADREKFKDMGFTLKDVDFKEHSEESLREVFSEVALIYVGGGNTFYLLQKMRESGFDKVLPEFLDKGIVYAGGSAGAAVVGADIEPLKYIDDPEKVSRLASTRGLGLVDFVILPHYGEEKYADRFEKTINEFKDQFKLVTLTNEQAIVVKDGDWRIVKST